MILITKLVSALKNSLNGFRLTLREEFAFRLEILVCAIILSFTFWIDAAKSDKLFVVFSLGVMLIAELLNTAIEKANDALKKSNDPLVKFSKDAGSAAVFIAGCLVGISLVNLFF